jgi:hypothetical protein
MIQNTSSEYVLAIRPFTRGIAYAVFEAPLSLVDWGIKEIRGAKWNARCFALARDLIERTRPDSLVLPSQAASAGQPGRGDRLLALIDTHALANSIEVRRYAQLDIRTCFEGVGARNRYEIAQAIASQIQALTPKLPSIRKAWDPENPRMYLFDAAALAMTYYASAPSPEDD